jgi:Chitobiase/beta-hexosaminidase C-terminal domain
MRRFFGVAVLALGMLMGARGAAAQLIDPSTGVMVDAGSDPMDFSAVASGQPGNIGMELSAQASEQAQAMAQQSMADMQATAEQAAADSQASMASFMSSTNSNDDVPVAQVPALPATPKPVITPGGGTFKGSVQVTIADSDSVAAVFYTTNGKKPTTSSERYDGPIAVSAKTKVQALAFDVNMQPSGVVTKTFKVKAAKGSSLPEGAS